MGRSPMFEAMTDKYRNLMDEDDEDDLDDDSDDTDHDKETDDE